MLLMRNYTCKWNIRVLNLDDYLRNLNVIFGRKDVSTLSKTILFLINFSTTKIDYYICVMSKCSFLLYLLG